MELVRKFLNQEEAHIAYSYLRANGIEAELEGANTFSTMPHVGMGATMLRLVVPEEQAGEADYLLKNAASGGTAFTEEEWAGVDTGEPEDETTGGGFFIPYRPLILVTIALMLVYFIL